MLSKDGPETKRFFGRFCFSLPMLCGCPHQSAWMSHGPWHGASILRAHYHQAAGQAFRMDAQKGTACYN